MGSILRMAIIIVFVQTLSTFGVSQFVEDPTRKIFFKIWVNKQEIKIVHHKNGDVVDLEFDFQSENDNNIVISCNAAFPVMWSEIVFHNQNAKTPKVKTDESVVHDDGRGLTFQTTLTFNGNGNPGRFKCRSVTTADVVKSITIYVKSSHSNDGQILLLNPGKQFIVTPRLGETNIFFPCHLSSQSSDIYVEKMGTWSSKGRAVDIPFDSVFNGFLISTISLSKFVGIYRCIQTGFQDFVQVEVMAPLEYKVSPSQKQSFLVGGIDSPIRTSCLSPTPIKLRVDVTGTKKVSGHSITTHTFRPNHTFVHVQDLVYYPSVVPEERGEIICELQNGEIIHKWKYRSSSTKLILQISEDGRKLKCCGTNTSTIPELRAVYFQSYVGMLSNISSAHHPFTYYKIVQSSEEPYCTVLEPLKTGGLLVSCSSGGIEKLASYFIDINRELSNINEEDKISLDKMVRVEAIQSSKEGKSQVINCEWSPFFLAQNAYWTIIDDDKNLNTSSEVTQNPDNGVFQSTLIISPEEIIEMTESTNISCTLTLWHENKVNWNPKLLQINLKQFSIPVHEKASPDSEKSEFSSSHIKDDLSTTSPNINTNNTPIIVDCTIHSSWTSMLISLIVSLVVVIIVQTAIIYKILARIIPSSSNKPMALDGTEWEDSFDRENRKGPNRMSQFRLRDRSSSYYNRLPPIHEHEYDRRNYRSMTVD